MPFRMKPTDRDLLKRVEECVHSVAPDAELKLYGSRARGDAGLHSDWDFLILLDQPLTRYRIGVLKDIIYDLELKTDTVLSTIVRTRHEWYSPRYSVLPFRQIVEQEGIPV